MSLRNHSPRMSCEMLISKLPAIASIVLRHGSLRPFSSREINGLPIPLSAARSSCPHPRFSLSLRMRNPRRTQISSFLPLIFQAWGQDGLQRVAYRLSGITMVTLSNPRPFSYKQIGHNPQPIEFINKSGRIGLLPATLSLTALHFVN